MHAPIAPRAQLLAEIRRLKEELQRAALAGGGPGGPDPGPPALVPAPGGGGRDSEAGHGWAGCDSDVN